MKEECYNPSKSLYMQIKETLIQEIKAGTFIKDQKIPSEKKLCERFNVSRTTVRQAIREITTEGFLYAVQGKGMYVLDYDQNKINQPLQTLTTFQDTIVSKGYNAGTKLIKKRTLTVDFAISKILNLGINDQVMNLQLLGTADGKPIVVYESYFEETSGILICKEAESKIDRNIAFSTLDLYKDIEDIKPQYIEQTFEAVGADITVSELLQVQVGTPLFLITSLVYTNDENPIEYKKAFYLADKYRFHIKRVI